MSVTVIAGANNGTFPLDGQTVSQVRDNESVAELFSLQGNETAEVSNDNGVTWNTVGNDHVLGSGSQVRFTRPAGEKG